MEIKKSESEIVYQNDELDLPRVSLRSLRSLWQRSVAIEISIGEVNAQISDKQ